MIFESKAFKDWGAHREAQQKTDMAVIERLDVVIRSLSHLAKIFGKSR